MTVTIIGLYRPGRIYRDSTPDAARRAYHDEFSGLEGTILSVTEAEEEVSADG